MAGSAIETVFSLFAGAIFVMTCVSIIGSILAALWAVSREGTGSTKDQQTLAASDVTQPEDLQEASHRVLRTRKGPTPREGGFPISPWRHEPVAKDKRIA
jgi:hypothetical protein